MTEKTAPLRATLKSGTGYDAPWLTVDANTPEELEQRLRAIMAGGALEAVAEAAGQFRATQLTVPPAGNAAPQQAAPAQQGGWSTPPQQPQQPPPGGGWGGAAQHPEGKSCQACGSVLEYKVINRKSDGKQFRFWACPNQRQRDDGHTSEFA